jgi:hypothetical protein
MSDLNFSSNFKQSLAGIDENSKTRPCPFCEASNGQGHKESCYFRTAKTKAWNTRPIEDTLRAERDEWKADAERLAKDNERMAQLIGGKHFIAWKNIEQHRVLVEKYKTKKNNSWDKLSKQVLDENRGAWEELEKEGK